MDRTLHALARHRRIVGPLKEERPSDRMSEKMTRNQHGHVLNLAMLEFSDKSSSFIKHTHMIGLVIEVSKLNLRDGLKISLVYSVKLSE